jgi:enhancer of yellow 2 transcription factor
MPVTSAKISAESDALYGQVQRRLVQNGDWDRIQALLSYKLNESGWTDDLRHRSKERARVMEPLSFHALLAELTLHTPTSIPLAVKREVLSVIQQHLEKQFES